MMNQETLTRVLQNGGVVGAGGAGFPSYAKLNEQADTILLNCAECEPLLRLHRQVLAQYAHEILSALTTVADALDAKDVLIAVKPAYTEAVEAVKAELVNFPKVSLRLLPEVYPAGDEVITIYEATGRVVEAGKLPITVGVIVYNVETMLNAYRAITGGTGVTEKYITVTGAVKNPITVKVPLGVTYGSLIALAGGATVEDFAIVAGGPMTGPVGHVNDVVTKTSNAVLVLPKHHYVIERKQVGTSVSINRVRSACCQCHYCTDLCPRHLIGHPIDPAALMRAVAGNVTSNPEPFLNANFCSNCGLCEMFSCFQGLSPRTVINSVRGELRKNGIKPPEAKMSGVNPNRDGRYVSVKRLVARLDLAKYDKPAPIVDYTDSPNSVKLMLSQGIGAPAEAVVKVGDTVKVGDLIAGPAEGKLSVGLHASINGTVAEVTDRYILIKA